MVRPLGTATRSPELLDGSLHDRVNSHSYRRIVTSQQLSELASDDNNTRNSNNNKGRITKVSAGHDHLVIVTGM